MRVHRIGEFAGNADYTFVPVSWAQDHRLHLEARGVLAHILTQAPGWSADVVVEDYPAAALFELESLGYLTRQGEDLVLDYREG